MKTLTIHDVWGAGNRASIRLDRVVREALFDIAGRKHCTVDDLLTEINRERRGATFTTATRSYVVTYYRAMMQLALQGGAGSAAR